ncbi:MAG: ribosome-binding factor A [Cyclobacteriaceae bacterium]
MESKRQLKFNRMLLRDLSEIFQREMSGQFGKAFITITRVQISPDLSLARVHFSVLLEEDKAEALGHVRQKTSEIRKHLGLKIGKQVRKIPELIFYLDEGASHASRIDQILADLKIPDSNESDGSNSQE